MIHDQMCFRYLVVASDLNAHGTLHGGVLLRWIDEAAGMHSRKLTNRVCVTRSMGNIQFVSKAKAGDIIVIETELQRVGKTSLVFSVSAHEDISSRAVADVENIVFVSIDHQGNKVNHGLQENTDESR